MSPEPEHMHFAIRWWQELLTGSIIILFGWYAKTKGTSQITPLSEAHIDNKMKICQQEILLELNTRLEEHEEKIVSRIRDLLP